MQDQVVAALNEHFSTDQVRSRRGPGGKQLSYLETHAVIARLNEALGADWSFEVTEYRILDREVVAVVTLFAWSLFTHRLSGSRGQNSQKRNLRPDMRISISGLYRMREMQKG